MAFTNVQNYITYMYQRQKIPDMRIYFHSHQFEILLVFEIKLNVHASQLRPDYDSKTLQGPTSQNVNQIMFYKLR